MIIVGGWLRVDAAHRDSYVEQCRSAVEQARATPGCIDFSVAPDLLDAERVNIFEQWESVDAVEGFRQSGPSEEQQSVILAAHVVQHEIASSVDLT